MIYIWKGTITKVGFHFTFKVRVHFAHWAWDGKLSSNESFFAKKLILFFLFSSRMMWHVTTFLLFPWMWCNGMLPWVSNALQRWSDQWLTKFVIYYCIIYAFYKSIKNVSFFNLVCVFHCKPIFVYVFHCRFIQLNLGFNSILKFDIIQVFVFVHLWLCCKLACVFYYELWPNLVLLTITLVMFVNLCDPICGATTIVATSL